YTRWRDGNVSERKLADEIIKEAILRIHDEAKGRYGHRPIHAHLKEEEVNCGRDRTLRLMNELGVVSSQKKRFKPLGTDSNHSFGYSPNLLRELGKPEKCDQVWVADTTYLDCENGWMYLATVMGLYSRRIIGWSISDRNNTALICEALRAAVLSRGAIQPGIIHHSDRGSTYASHEYRSLMASEFMDSSMSAKGNCYDNVAMEPFYGRFKTSSVRRYQFSDESELRAYVFEYIEIFYNRYRKHSSLGYQSPLQFEAKFAPRGGHSRRTLR
ncbi:IS3 family transposase, partial [Verrucomicrobia bacterium]|nr:IS3 family transposase [Verrucomicrobiota bacterium]